METVPVEHRLISLFKRLFIGVRSEEEIFFLSIVISGEKYRYFGFVLYISAVNKAFESLAF